MAKYYGDHYSTATSSTAVDDPRIKITAGIDHSALRYKRGSCTAPASITTADVLTFFSMKSSDRLINLYLSTPSFTGTGQPADCGLYKNADTDVNEAVVDVDLFGNEAAPLDDLTVAVARVELLTLGDLENEDRGKRLWVMAAEGAADYTEDPFELWDVCITMGTESSVTAGAEVILEAVYTAGAGS